MTNLLKSPALKVGDEYKCPNNHKAKIVWISDSGNLIGVKCPRKHFNKLTKVADRGKHRTFRGSYPTKEKKEFVRNMVFLISV